MLLDVLLVAGCVLFIAVFLKKSTIGPFFILLAYTQSTGLISSIVVESGQYVTETGQSTSYIGASKWYALIIFFMFATTWLLSNLITRSIPPSPTKIHHLHHKKIATTGIYCVLALLYLNLIVSGPPLFFEHITRFNFWETYSKIPFAGLIFGELSIPVIISAGILISENIRAASQRKTPKKYIFIIVIYLLYLFLLEHKFNGFVIAISFLIAPILISRREQGKSLLSKKDLTYALIALATMLYMSYIFFSRSAGGVIDEVGGSALRGVLYRAFVLQGYSWHSFFSLYQNNGAQEIPSNIKIMEYAITSITANPSFFINNGINIANIYPGVLLASGGIGSVISVTMLFSAALATLGVASYRLLNSGSFISTTISIQLLFWTMGAIPSCNISIFYSAKYLIFLTALLAIPSIKKLIMSKV